MPVLPLGEAVFRAPGAHPTALGPFSLTPVAAATGVKGPAMPVYSRPRYKPGRTVSRPTNYLKCHAHPKRDPKRKFTVQDAGRVCCSVLRSDPKSSIELIVAEVERRCPDESRKQRPRSAAEEIAAAMANIAQNNLLLISIETLLAVLLTLLGIVVALGRVFPVARVVSAGALVARTQVAIVVQRAITQRAANDALFNRLAETLRRAA